MSPTQALLVEAALSLPAEGFTREELWREMQRIRQEQPHASRIVPMQKTLAVCVDQGWIRAVDGFTWMQPDERGRQALIKHKAMVASWSHQPVQ